MKYQGKGYIKFNNKQHRGLVEINPCGRFISVKIPMEDRSTSLLLSNDNKIYDSKYSITDLKVELPNGAISHENLKNLSIKRFIPGTISIYDSELVRSLSLHQQEVGITTIDFFPQNSLQVFKYEDVSTERASELIFHDTKIRTYKKLELVLNSRPYILSCANDILIVRSNVNLIPNQHKFYRILSLLQGGKITYRTGFYKDKIEINFIEDGINKHLGEIFKEDSAKKEFIENLWHYENSLGAREKNKHELFSEYLLEGMSANTTTENKVISLYTALEIIDGSKTLNKQSISKTLQLSLNISHIIAKIRNKIIHQGYTGLDALYESIEEVKNNTTLKRMPFSTTKKHKSFFNFYIFLVINLYLSLLRKIGIKNKNLQYKIFLK